MNKKILAYASAAFAAFQFATPSAASAAQSDRLLISAPATATVGQPFDVSVSVVSADGKTTRKYADAEVMFNFCKPLDGSKFPDETYSFSESDKGVKTFRGAFVPKKSGILTLCVSGYGDGFDVADGFKNVKVLRGDGAFVDAKLVGTIRGNGWYVSWDPRLAIFQRKVAKMSERDILKLWDGMEAQVRRFERNPSAWTAMKAFWMVAAAKLNAETYTADGKWVPVSESGHKALTDRINLELSWGGKWAETLNSPVQITGEYEYVK